VLQLMVWTKRFLKKDTVVLSLALSLALTLVEMAREIGFLAWKWVAECRRRAITIPAHPH